MIAALAFGWLSALCWGAVAIAATPPTREGTPWMVLAWNSAISAVASLTAAAFTGAPNLGGAATWYIVLAGVAFAAGLIVCLLAIAGGQVSIVTAIVACDGAVAALLALGSGATVSALTAVGLLGILVGVVSMSQSTSAEPAADVRYAPATTLRTPVVVALAGGGAVLLGLTLFAAGEAESAGTLWVAGISRAIAAITAFSIAAVGRRSLRCPRNCVPWLVASGVLDAGGFCAFVVGAGHDFIVASVASSQYAVVGVMGAVLFLGERLTRVQVGGIVAAIAGTTLIVAGG